MLTVLKNIQGGFTGCSINDSLVFVFKSRDTAHTKGVGIIKGV